MARDPTVTSTSGFVQMMVLIALGTISAVVMATMLVATSANSSTAALERLVQTDALTTSRFNRLEAAMVDPADDLETRALEPDAAAEIQVGDKRMALQIEGIGGKIDPLRTDPDVIVRYLANSGLTSAEQVRAMDTIAQARESSDASSAANAVLIALLDRKPAPELSQDFTQFADHSGIDPAYASPSVVAAIPDLPASSGVRISGVAIEDLAKLNLQSRYFAPNGTRFSLVAHIDWGPTQSSQRQLPVEVSGAGRLVALAGPN